MSPPDRYGPTHLLNPWMRWDERVDATRARRQWDALVDAIGDAGGVVEVMPSGGRSGALTFTRDTAVVVDTARAVVLRNHGARGDLEPRRVARWLRREGYRVESLPRGDRIDGGNVVAVPEGWLIGLPPGARPDPARRLVQRLGGGRAMAIPLASNAFAHLDTVLADLGGRGWFVYPGGLVDTRIEGADWERLWSGRPVITVDEAEVRRLACNVVIVGTTVIGGGLSTRLCRQVEALELDPRPVRLDEFHRAGGGAHCLTLGLPPQRPWECEHDAPQDATGR